MFMYVHCGDLREARRVFDALSNRKVCMDLSVCPGSAVSLVNCDAGFMYCKYSENFML